MGHQKSIKFRNKLFSLPFVTAAGQITTRLVRRWQLATDRCLHERQHSEPMLEVPYYLQLASMAVSGARLSPNRSITASSGQNITPLSLGEETSGKILCFSVFCRPPTRVASEILSSWFLLDPRWNRLLPSPILGFRNFGTASAVCG